MNEIVAREAGSARAAKLSFVIPVKDEQDTLGTLVEGIVKACSDAGSPSPEIIFVDDGSKDRSWPVMQELVEKFPGVVRALKLRRNFGKAIGLNAGFRVATGEIIFTMDADLQDDPREVPRFLDKLDEGFDLVSGWKARRHDPLNKTLPSKVFNRITAKMSGVPLHDFNCGFKAYRREIVEQINLYGELHRYIPVLAHDQGFRIGEIEVEHHPRRHGVSKYGFERYVRGFLDLVTILATTRYLQRPGHLFGGLGVISGLIGVIILTYLTGLWLFGHPIGHRPLLQVGALFMVFSVQMISIGAIAELLIRITNPRDVANLVVADRHLSAPLPPGRPEVSRLSASR